MSSSKRHDSDSDDSDLDTDTKRKTFFGRLADRIKTNADLKDEERRVKDLEKRNALAKQKLAAKEAAREIKVKKEFAAEEKEIARQKYEQELQRKKDAIEAEQYALRIQSEEAEERRAAQVQERKAAMRIRQLELANKEKDLRKQLADETMTVEYTTLIDDQGNVRVVPKITGRITGFNSDGASRALEFGRQIQDDINSHMGKLLAPPPPPPPQATPDDRSEMY
ncbi:hypothetical protein DFJ73DRAFT_852179 [Zopfochytrium polystomum]|nr:hypothetical protein DFJ73DRAFT_852179 [Zopfochytrium polystomum]